MVFAESIGESALTIALATLSNWWAIIGLVSPLLLDIPEMVGAKRFQVFSARLRQSIRKRWKAGLVLTLFLAMFGAYHDQRVLLEEAQAKFTQLTEAARNPQNDPLSIYQRGRSIGTFGMVYNTQGRELIDMATTDRPIDFREPLLIQNRRFQCNEIEPASIMVFGAAKTYAYKNLICDLIKN